MAAVRIKRVDWLIGVTVLGSMLLVWLVLIGLDAMMQFGRQLGFIGRNGYTLSNAIFYVVVTIPRRMYEMFTFAALIGGLLGLGGLASTGELTALRAAGMSRLRIAVSAVGIVAVLVAGVVVMGETVGPWGDQQAQALQVRLRSGGNLGLTSSGLWARDGDRIINAKSQALRNAGDHSYVQLMDVRVFTLTPDGQQLSRFDQANTAEQVGKQWVLDKVRTTTVDDNGVHSSTSQSERWDSKLDPEVLQQSLVQPQYLAMRDLQHIIDYKKKNGENTRPYEIPLWSRVMYPFNVLVLVLCSMPFAFGALRSGGLGKRIFMGMILAISWYFVQKAIVSFGTVYGIPPLMANILPAVLLAVIGWFYFRKHA
ncbi:LPS export ABC transporter permease LptG [Dyella mobilis]|uniref:LPS export ABC transporter permease LptG n=1 Tax=Dyella mobilis TaxID=1849582 RepID=A0ABS2KH90_9GAMM|nr:LPS export ABC transporter permease LptG [Dyella mobilis]MBM7130288.1 LPS export ABC transporter permease LptG [Dyella mobilis]GLQ96914.1 LPS export ABC transporter permease LptG [Dyella mobilis]